MRCQCGRSLFSLRHEFFITDTEEASGRGNSPIEITMESKRDLDVPYDGAGGFEIGDVRSDDTGDAKVPGDLVGGGAGAGGQSREQRGASRVRG